MKKKSVLVASAILVMIVSACGSTSKENVVVSREHTENMQIKDDKVAMDESTDEREEKSQEDEIPEPVTEVQSTEEVEQLHSREEVSGNYMVVRDQVVYIGDDMSRLEEILGTPDDYSAAASCLGFGDDKMYTYDSVVIYTQPLDGKDLVYIIDIEGEAELPNGVKIGSTVSELREIYGEELVQNGNYLEYECDGITVSFEYEGDTVSYIEIF